VCDLSYVASMSVLAIAAGTAALVVGAYVPGLLALAVGALGLVLTTRRGSSDARRR
jgi:hypothetical protein